MFFIDYDHISADSCKFVLKSVLSDTYILNHVVSSANRLLTFLSTKGPENVPYWLYYRTLADVANCFAFLKSVEAHSCTILEESETVYKKLLLQIEEIERKTINVEKQFKGFYSDEEVNAVKEASNA